MSGDAEILELARFQRTDLRLKQNANIFILSGFIHFFVCVARQLFRRVVNGDYVIINFTTEISLPIPEQLNYLGRV